jgi:hypothetical protein
MKSSVVWRSTILQDNIQMMHIEELHDLYVSSNIIRVIKPRRMTWFGHAERVLEGIGKCGVLVGKPEGENHLEDPGKDMIILLTLILLTWKKIVS